MICYQSRRIWNMLSQFFGRRRCFQEVSRRRHLILDGVQRHRILGSILGKARETERDLKPALRKWKAKTKNSTEYQFSESHPYVIVLMRVL